MNWAFLKREWGAVSFVLTVLVGLLVVPIALFFGHQSAATQLPPAPSPSASATVASGARTASPSPSAATASPAPSASPSR